MTDKTYNFGEKTKEKVKCSPPKKDKDGKDIFWEELEVWQTPKYLQSKEKAIEIIEKGGYGVTEGDFWILMNKGGSKMCYTGLIISHNGVLKINAKLDKEKRFKPECADIYKDINGDIVMRYVSPEQGIYEFGEVSPKNCKNEYPYAMALKRLQDRVVLKTSEIAFFGIYSDSESDSFKEAPDESKEESLKDNKGFFKEPKGPLAGIAEQGNQEMQEKKAEKKAVDTEEKLKKEEEGLERLKATLASFGSVAEIEGYLNETPRGSKSTRLQVINRMNEINVGQAKVIIRDAKFAVDPEYKGE